MKTANKILLGIGVVILGVSLLFGLPSYNRHQRVWNAQNEIQVNKMLIAQTEQLIAVEKQRAAIRVQEALGIAASQKIINATLTDRYLQHEAIGAQVHMANSPNHTQIYIPVGNNGIPLVRTVN